MRRGEENHAHRNPSDVFNTEVIRDRSSSAFCFISVRNFAIRVQCQCGARRIVWAVQDIENHLVDKLDGPISQRTFEWAARRQAGGARDASCELTKRISGLTKRF
jgi:hypothetical protein